jgi:4-hydroxyphenylpyruvate dioxygenase
MPLQLAMNTGTFNFQSVDFLSMIQATSRAEFTGINLRDNHTQEFVQQGHSVQEIKDLLNEYELHPVAFDALRDWQNWEDLGGKEKEEFRKRAGQCFDVCKGIGCDCIACPTYAEDGDIFRDIRSFKEVCDIAKAYDIRLALEFLPWTALRDMRMAWEVVRRANCSNGGLLVDTFHYFKGGSTIDDLQEVPTEKIFLVHLDDAPDLRIDSKEMCFHHRVFPGEGIFPLGQFLDMLLLEKGYEGWISLEVINKENQHADYDEIAQRGKKSLEKVLSRYNL